MSDAAIRVLGVGKRFRIGQRERYQTLRDSLVRAATAPARAATALWRRQASSPDTQAFWALRDVTFDVPAGSAVGIIGRNGAGKSTLLKILSRITEPTTGRVELRGRVGSLLEVGTGFHPELSGRDNIYLNGAILGMKREEVSRKFDEIVAFSEVDRFIDTPVKRYSSGMYMRLAFAVAAHLEPEILVVDEVLAVGDAQFQRKCLGRMGDVAREGRTVLFVSHNMAAVASLCRTAVCLSQGQLVDSGAASDVVTRYISNTRKTAAGTEWADRSKAPGDDVMKLVSVSVDCAGGAGSMLPREEPLQIEVTYDLLIDSSVCNVSIHLFNDEQVCVFNAISPPTARRVGLVRETCTVPGGLLNTGGYRAEVLLVKDASRVCAFVPSGAEFELFETRRDINWYGHWRGVIRPSLAWTSQNGVVVQPESVSSVEHDAQPADEPVL